MRLHVTVEMMRVCITLTALIADMDFIVRVVGPLLMIVQGLSVLEFQFADITFHVEIFGIVRRQMEVQLSFLEESFAAVRTDVLFLLHVDSGEVRLQILWC